MENQNNLEHLPDHLKRLAMFTTILEACHKSTVCSKLLNKLYNETLTQSKKEGFKLCTLFPLETPIVGQYSDDQIDQLHADHAEFVRREVLNEGNNHPF
jgi:hypothetical protein